MLTPRMSSVCLLLTALSAGAQTGPQASVLNVAQLSATGSVEVQQDLLSLVMSTTRDGPEAAVVQTQLRQALDAALAQVRPAMLARQLDLRTGNFSLYPRYGKDGKINGWQGSTALVLEGRDFQRITTSAAKVQTLSISSVGFSLSREQRERVEREAQTQAIERFKVKAQELAKGFGFEGYSLREVSVSANDLGPQPRPRLMAMQKSEGADAGLSVEAGKSTVLVNVNGSVQMR